MIELSGPRWKEFEGGYHDRYDASIPLSHLENEAEDVHLIWSELWENLSHQGDVGIASYAAIPHIVRIVRTRQIFNYNPFAIVVPVELARGRGQNPELPEWLREDYIEALWCMAKYGCINLDKEWDAGIVKSVLALIAIIKGKRELGELIFEVDDGYERELLNQFFAG